MLNLDISGHEEKIAKHITYFIETQVTERGVDGILLLFSGYMDSTVVSKLCLEAIDKDSIKFLIRTNKYFDKQEDMLEMSINYLEISEDNMVTCDIEPMLKGLGSKTILPGSIREVPSLYQPLSYSLIKNAAKGEIEDKPYGMMGKAHSEREKWIHRIIAHNKLRSRLQMAVAYYTAEQENRLLLGTINKTELSTGLFTKWGHSHCSDMMPLGQLYRSQILQLAKYLELPKPIRSLSKADLIPGVQNKYMYFFGLPAIDVDRILIRLEQGQSNKEIHSSTDLSMNTIEKITTYYNSAAYTRQAPLIPKVYSP